MSTLIGRLLVGTRLDPSGFKDGAKKSTKHLTAFEKRVKGIGKSIVSALGTMGAAFAIGAVVQDAAETIREFDQKVANLAATSGRSRDSIGALVQNAKEVGAVSAFSASQVLDLQTELAKLGNTEDEIISMTKSVGDFSIAVGATAADAAVLAGGVLKSFGKTAEETESVVSSLAVATTKSALDFNKLNVALPLVGTAADQSGISLQRTVSLLGVLADRNIDASTSGTALRNIFLDLKDKGLTYEQAMDQINNSTDSLNEANKLFGKRGAVVAAVLAQSREQADKLEKSITGVDGALKQMTDERLNTINGQLTLLASSWEGFILSLESGDSALGTIFKKTIGYATDLVSSFSEISNTVSFQERFIYTFFGTDSERQKILDDLNTAKEIQKETDANVQTRNGGILNSIGIDFFNEKPLTGELDAAIKELNKTATETGGNITKVGKDLEDTEAKVITFSDEARKLESEINNLAESFIRSGSTNDSFKNSIQEKQAKLIALNQEAQKAIDLQTELLGRKEVAPEVIGGIPLPSSVESTEDPKPITFEEIVSVTEATKELKDANDDLADSYTKMAEAMSNSLSQGANSFGEYASSVLGSIQSVIGGLIKQTVANAVSSAVASAPFPFNIALGPIAGGLAAGIFNTALNSVTAPKLAEGGVIRKPTFAMVGEYPGAATNPEIVAPESKLRNIFGTELARSGSNRMYSVTKGSDIYTSQEKYNYRISRTG